MDSFGADGWMNRMKKSENLKEDEVLESEEGQGAEDRRLMTDDGRRKTEVGGLKTENG